MIKALLLFEKGVIMQTIENPYTADEIAKNLPERLKFFRIKANMTTQEVSNYLGKTQSTISMWENGKALPSVETMLKICNLYKINDINELIDCTECYENENLSDFKNLNRTEQNLIKLWRSAKPHVRAAITTLLKECN